MSHFGEALHPDDVPPWHWGDDLIVDEPDEAATDDEGEDDANERTD